mmetsp:Transcript_5306/g.14725  ORF Transcript_5306/g.14725 Transcript_5306/m.14725 type:complete len:241 (-) Transcript_5306:651-1373(-)
MPGVLRLEDPAPSVCQAQEPRCANSAALVNGHAVPRVDCQAGTRLVGVCRRSTDLHVVIAHDAVVPQTPGKVACLLDVRSHLTHDDKPVFGLEDPTPAIGELQEPCSSHRAPLINSDAIPRTQNETCSRIIRVRWRDPGLHIAVAHNAVVPKATLEAVSLCHDEQPVFGFEDPAPAIGKVQKPRALHHSPVVGDDHLAGVQEVTDPSVIRIRGGRSHLNVILAHHHIVPLRRVIAVAPST